MAVTAPDSALLMAVDPSAAQQLQTTSPPGIDAPVPVEKAPPAQAVKMEETGLLSHDQPGGQISCIISLTENSQVVRFTNCAIHFRKIGKDPEVISQDLCNTCSSNQPQS